MQKATRKDGPPKGVFRNKGAATRQTQRKRPVSVPEFPNSYRNLVSCCLECNSRKGDRPARDFLRTLYRLGHLTPAELDARLRALKDLAAGKLRPALMENGK